MQNLCPKPNPNHGPLTPGAKLPILLAADSKYGDNKPNSRNWHTPYSFSGRVVRIFHSGPHAAGFSTPICKQVLGPLPLQWAGIPDDRKIAELPLA